MGVIVVVAGGIFCVAHEEGVVSIHLCLVGYDVAFSLLSNHVVDESLSCFKVIANLLHLVFGASFREHW